MIQIFNHACVCGISIEITETITVYIANTRAYRISDVFVLLTSFTMSENTSLTKSRRVRFPVNTNRKEFRSYGETTFLGTRGTQTKRTS